MSKLQTYVLKEVIKALLLAFIVLLAIMMLGFGVQMLQEGLDVVRLHGIAFYMAVYCAPWVIPSALLTAVIMVFGRLSADNEILAMQVEGMHLWHILSPVYILALFLSLFGTYLHFEGAPKARHRIENMQAEALMQVLMDRILYSAGRQFHVSPYIVSFEGYDDGTLEDVKIMQSGRQGALSMVIHARSGTLRQPDGRPDILRLELEDCAVTQLGGEGLGEPGTTWAARAEFPMQVGSMPDEDDKDIRHMSFFGEMREKKRSLEKKIEGHDRRFRNPGEKSDSLSDEISVLNTQRSELRNARDRLRRRIERLETEIDNEREVIEDRQNRLQRHEEELQTMKVRELELIHTLDELMGEGEDGDEHFQKISETQSELNEVRSQIGELEENCDDLREKLDDLTASVRVKEKSIEELSTKEKRLRREISKISEERSELNSARRIANVQEDIREIKIRTQRRLTLAFAALAFTVLGIPLGLFSQRRSTIMAFGAGFFIMIAVFYPFMVWGQIMGETGLMHVIPSMWMGNGVTFMIGGIMTLMLFRR